MDFTNLLHLYCYRISTECGNNRTKCTTLKLNGFIFDENRRTINKWCVASRDGNRYQCVPRHNFRNYIWFDDYRAEETRVNVCFWNKTSWFTAEKLDSRLNDFQKVLPRVHPFRGLLVVGGLVLKYLFGTATVTDVQLIHEVVEELRQRNSDIAHSVLNQLSYVQDLGKINAESIANLSSVVKDQMIQSHDQFLSITKVMLWLNATFHRESSVFTVIRQLEFTLLKLIQHIDDLFNAVQYPTLGKLPIKLVNPLQLQNILRNLTLQLPEGYELMAGTSREIIHLYYELTKVSVVANVYSVNLVLTVPLKWANLHFTLFRLITLPIQISSDKFVKYLVYYSYFALQHSRRVYTLFTEADYKRCSRESITICPEETAVYRSQSLICEVSLFFPTESTYRVCRRKLIFHHQTSFLQRHGELCVYYFPKQHQITLRCIKHNNQVLHTLSPEVGYSTTPLDAPLLPTHSKYSRNHMDWRRQKWVHQYFIYRTTSL